MLESKTTSFAKEVVFFILANKFLTKSLGIGYNSDIKKKFKLSRLSRM